MSDSLDTAVERFHELIVTARAETPNISTDPYLDALALWIVVVPQARDILSTLDSHESTLGEVEFVYRVAVEAWLRGTVPHGLRVEVALRDRIRMALGQPVACVD